MPLLIDPTAYDLPVGVSTSGQIIVGEDQRGPPKGQWGGVGDFVEGEIDKLVSGTFGWLYLPVTVAGALTLLFFTK